MANDRSCFILRKVAITSVSAIVVLYPHWLFAFDVSFYLYEGSRNLKEMQNWKKRQKRQTKTGSGNEKADEMKGRNRDPQQSESKHYVSCFLKRSMAPLPLTFTMTRRKQADPPPLPVLHPVVYELLRWRTDHRRHRLGVNRVPFIGVDTAGGPIRQPKHGWGRGRPMLSEPLQLTRSLGTLQTTVKLGKLPENMSPCRWYPC